MNPGEPDRFRQLRQVFFARVDLGRSANPVCRRRRIPCRRCRRFCRNPASAMPNPRGGEQDGVVGVHPGADADADVLAPRHFPFQGEACVAVYEKGLFAVRAGRIKRIERAPVAGRVVEIDGKDAGRIRSRVDDFQMQGRQGAEVSEARSVQEMLPAIIARAISCKRFMAASFKRLRL